MAEFVITTDLRPWREAQIAANFEETEAALQEMMDPYANMVVTEDGVRAAKSDRAKINNVAKRIDEVRLATKRELEAPIKEFEQKCNKLKMIASSAAENLDKQIKGFEEQARSGKMQTLEDFYNEKASAETRDFLTFAQIREKNPKWVNAGYSVESAKNDIMRQLANITAGLAVIRNLDTPHKAALLEKFRQTGDLSDTMSLHNRLTETERNEAQRAERAAKMAELERAAARETPTPSAPQTPPPTPQGEQDEPVRVIDFRIWVTQRQVAALKEFLMKNGIRYGKVPK